MAPGGRAAATIPFCNRGPNVQISNPFGVILESPALRGDAYWDLITDVFKLRYHRPKDEPRDDWNLAGAAQLARVALYLGYSVSERGDAR